ncbi:hypothetical protein ACQPU1_15640 [Clostridium paraputrificum]|uniref:hypothetical protein n=1 Tax=Clostridium paraputrificum TaxID=29363 RepID=UPI003D325F06
MKSAIHVRFKEEEPYEKISPFIKFKDRFKIRCTGEEIIKDFNTKIKYTEIPQNINVEAYKYNIVRTFDRFKEDNSLLCPSGKRNYDYNFLNEFQKKLFAFSVVESIKLLLFKSHKSIRSANILIDDGSKKENRYIVEELAKEARNIIILTKRSSRIEKLREYIISNYGAVIQVIHEEESMKSIDFVISSEDKVYNLNNVWYLDNFYKPNKDGIYVNNVGFKVPWESSLEFYPPELLGGILNVGKKESIRDILRKNDIMLEQISFNSKDIVI